MSAEKIREAIDIGGGQGCDIDGVIDALHKAGFVIVPAEPLHEWFTARAEVIEASIADIRVDVTFKAKLDRLAVAENTLRAMIAEEERE